MTDLVNIKVINDGIKTSVQIVEQRNNLQRKSDFITLKPPQERIAKAFGIFQSGGTCTFIFLFASVLYMHSLMKEIKTSEMLTSV